MAAKKKAKKTPDTTPEPATVSPPATVSHLEGPRIVDGFLYFGEKDLLKYELAQHKVVNAIQGIGLKKREMEQYKLDAEQRLKTFQVEIADLTALARRQEVELLGLQKELQEQYNLDFTQVTYDDVTGRVMLLGEPVQKQ